MVTRRSQGKRDPIEATLDAAFRPGDFIGYGAGRDFVSGLEAVEAHVEPLLATDPKRACSLYETLLAGAYEKAGEVDDSSGDLGMFVDGLYCGWLRARQAAGADVDETITFLVAQMDDDPFGFASRLDRHAVKVMDRVHLRAFGRLAGARLDAALAASEGAATAQVWSVRYWGEVLRAILVAQRDAKRYAVLCDRTGLAADWQAVVEAVRCAHRRKSGFIGDFERLVAGEEPGSGPSFLDRARGRWLMGVKS